MDEYNKLKELMSDISEKCYCAGWLIGTEFKLWELMKQAEKDNFNESYAWGQDVVEPEELLQLRNLSNKINGWWAYLDDKYNNSFKVFMSLKDFEKYYELVIKNEQNR